MTDEKKSTRERREILLLNYKKLKKRELVQVAQYISDLYGISCIFFTANRI
jgi:hypothetical protein